ncbi:MAG: hypothetical protein GX424_07060 [Clostridiales bacterium]|nr:hypothetical protein [Clostridiales bacterium]
MVNNSKTAIVISQIIATVQMVFGVLFVLFGLLGGLGQKTIDAADIVVIILFVGGGIWLILSSVKRRKLVRLFRQYVSILSRNESCSIADLALATKASEDAVQSKLQKMIKKKYFTSAYIDRDTHRVVLPRHAYPSAPNAADGINREAQNMPEVVTVVCKGCGAVNRLVKGQVSECEYCGSAIKGESSS